MDSPNLGSEGHMDAGATLSGGEPTPSEGPQPVDYSGDPPESPPSTATAEPLADPPIIISTDQGLPRPFDGPPNPPRWRPYRLLIVAGGGILVIAAAIIAALASRGGGSAPVTGPSPRPTQGPPRIASVTATPASPIEIKLTWSPASGTVDKYIVYRDGDLVATVSGSVTTYDDTLLRPTHLYTYSVEAADPSGRLSAQVSTSVTTPNPPPLSQARVEGQFLVKATFVSENFTNFRVGSTRRFAWQFDPRCAEGPCRVRIKINAPQEHFPLLARKGGTYSVKGTAELGRCGSSNLITTITIKFHVTKGRYIAGVWRATAIQGTFNEFAPATLSCQSGSGRETTTGRLQF